MKIPPSMAINAVYGKMPKKENPRMNFGEALSNMRQGMRLARTGWNGKGMYVTYDSGKAVGGIPKPKQELPSLWLIYEPCEEYPDGAFVPWVPSQTDVLADDWTYFIL